MPTTIRFYFDYDGKPLVSPRVLTIQDCYSGDFYLHSGSYAHHQSIWICRSYLDDVKFDPYNGGDDNSPSTLFSMVNTLIEFCDSMVTIEGLEAPNLSYSRYLMTPYNEKYKTLDKSNIPAPIPTVLTNLPSWALIRYDKLKRQKIELLVGKI